MKKNRKKTHKKVKGRFSRVLVIFCIFEMALVQVWGMWIADKDLYSTAELVSANHMVFGGELLMLCLKRLFAKERKEDKYGNFEETVNQIVES